MFVFAFAFIFFVDAAGTTLRGNTLSYSNLGVLDNIQNITLNDNPMFIIDQSGPFLKAYFNLPQDEVVTLIEEEFDQPAFSNTSTGFLGDVNNFDNTNGFSRFRETNINNGTNASAGFIGVNNLGFDISMGIASSNFEFQGNPAPNIGVLRLRSPSGMIFLNDFITGYFWLSDQNNTIGVQNPLTTMQLDPIGNLEIAGNFTGNQFYGEMFVEGNVIDTPISSADNYTEIQVLLEGLNNGFIYSSSSLEAGVNGTYKVDYSITFTDANNKNYRSTVGVNMIDQDKCVSGRKIANVDLGNMGSNCLLELIEGDNVTLLINNLDGDQDPTVEDANINLVRVGS